MGQEKDLGDLQAEADRPDAGLSIVDLQAGPRPEVVHGRIERVNRTSCLPVEQAEGGPHGCRPDGGPVPVQHKDAIFQYHGVLWLRKARD